MSKERYIEIIRSRLSPYRFEHSLNVAKAAVQLAERYGADKEKAYLAGILHDVMKDSDKEEQLQVLKKAGIILSAAERQNTKLWHAMSGAAFIEHELGLKDQEILLAVRYHSTGRAKMSLLEKVIYVADFISEDRNYNGVERMIQKSKISLELAMFEGLQFCILDLLKNKQIVHRDSIDAYNEILIENKQNGVAL